MRNILQFNKKFVSSGAMLKANIHAPGAKGLRAVKLTATLPNNQPADWLDQVVMVGPGDASMSLPIAYNDPAGKWTVHATDLYTNRVTKSDFLVI